DHPGRTGHDGLREMDQPFHVSVGTGEVHRRHDGLGGGGRDRDVGGKAGSRGLVVVVAPGRHVGTCAGDGWWVGAYWHFGALLSEQGSVTDTDGPPSGKLGARQPPSFRLRGRLYWLAVA